MSIASVATPPVAPFTSTLPLPGREAVQLEQLHREPGRVAGGAERHRFEQRQPLRQRHHPVGRHAAVLARSRRRARRPCRSSCRSLRRPALKRASLDETTVPGGVDAAGRADSCG